MNCNDKAGHKISLRACIYHDNKYEVGRNALSSRTLQMNIGRLSIHIPECMYSLTLRCHIVYNITRLQGLLCILLVNKQIVMGPMCLLFCP